MVQKRSFDEDELIEVPAKQAKQLEPDRQLISVLEFPSEPAVQNSHASGESDTEKPNFASAESMLCPKKDVEFKVSSSLACSSWITSNTHEEELKWESPFCIISSPDNYNAELPPRTTMHHADIYSYLLEHPPRKAVPLGPDFQANIPEWTGQRNQMTFRCLKNMHETSISTSHSLESIPSEILDSAEELSGCCVIPMPESILPADEVEVGVGRVDCSCADVGSIKCVQLHILEAREKLKRTLGQEAFAELGFCDMGEVVADNWSEEEEQLYHEVIFSNLSSLGKNFWHHLAVVFASRSKKEIVSYYFNVFMLRTRAEQNRFHPMNIDSDDDEWQGADDSSDNGVEVDEDDFGVESPVDPDRHVGVDKNAYASDEDGFRTDVVDYHLNRCDNNVNALKACPDNVLVKLSSNGISQMSRTGRSHDTGSSDIQGDLPASDAADIVALRVNMEKNDDRRHWTGNFSCTNGASHDFMLDTCNAREWDVGYVTCPKNEVDLLPTCSMIEEVFGAGSWNCKPRDGQGLS